MAREGIVFHFFFVFQKKLLVGFFLPRWIVVLSFLQVMAHAAWTFIPCTMENRDERITQNYRRVAWERIPFMRRASRFACAVRVTQRRGKKFKTTKKGQEEKKTWAPPSVVCHTASPPNRRATPPLSSGKRGSARR